MGFLFLLLPVSWAVATSSLLDLNIYVNEVNQVNWEPAQIAAEFYPEYLWEGGSVSFADYVVLRCSSTALNGWSVWVTSDSVDRDDHFLLVSENNDAFVRYVLIVEDERGQKKVVKNQEALVEVTHFDPKEHHLAIVPTLIGGQFKRIPAGYYRSQIEAFFIAQ